MDNAKLFCSKVAEWLKVHLPTPRDDVGKGNKFKSYEQGELEFVGISEI